MDERCTCFPQRQQLRSSSSCFFLGRGADLVAPSAHGGSPLAFPAGAAEGFGRCSGGRRAGQGGGHAGPICFQLQEGARSSSRLCCL